MKIKYHHLAVLALLTTHVLKADPEASKAQTESTDAGKSFNVGDKLPLESLQKMLWIQGEPLKSWTPGDIYLFEAWGTWCPPCIAAIPHMNDLHKKYSSKGVHVYSLNYNDPDLAKVTKFVKSKGDQMSYPVVYIKDSETNWKEFAGSMGVPSVFIVIDGEIRCQVRPGDLTDEALEDLIAGGDRRKKFIDPHARESLDSASESKISDAFKKALASGNLDEAEKQAKAMAKFNSNSSILFLVDLAFARKRADTMEGLLQKLSDDDVGFFIRSTLDTDTQEDMLRVFEKRVSTIFESNQQTAYGALLAYRQWKLGDKEAAIRTAKRIEQLSAPESKIGYTRFSNSLQNGRLPSFEELYKWLKERQPEERPEN